MTKINMNENMHLHGLRGATTSSSNSVESIEIAVSELITALISRNNLHPEHIVSITFSVTADLDACFPASIARKQSGWEEVALLDCQQMSVKGDLEKCIRILALAWLPNDQAAQHPYLGKAIILRPDRSNIS